MNVSDESDRLEDRIRIPRPAASRARVRWAGEGARPDRLCNRDQNELLCQALAKLIVRKMLPLSFVSSDTFKDFLAVVEPNFKVPCVQIIKNRLNLMREQLTNKIKAELSAATDMGCIADCWSSISQDSYLTITTYFLDPNWTPKSFTLTTEEACERHTAANLTARLHNVISHWDLDGKVLAVVTDNAPNAKNSVRALENLLITKGVTCAAHSLQLCVTNALKITGIRSICEQASKLVGHFRHSNIAATALERKQEQLGLVKLKLIQNCSTRWDSTFSMINRLILNRSAITNELSDRSITNPAISNKLEILDSEWLTMENIRKILKPFQVATTVLSGDSYSPTSMVRPIAFMLRENHLAILHDDDGLIESTKAILRDELTSQFDLNYDEEIGVNARQLARFLDPRFKDFLLEDPVARDDIRSSVRKLLANEMVGEIERQSQETAMDFLFQAPVVRNNGEAQFEMYLTEPQISHNIDPFEWWANREKRYPAMAELAQKYLCVPAISASAERVFSAAGNIVTL